MRRWSAFILSLVIAVSALAQKETPPTQMFTVAEFKEALAAARGLPDKKLAEHIADVKLTERMSDQTFAQISADLPGPISRLALLGLADESQFLDPPSAELPASPPPDHAAQQALVQKAIDYVTRAIAELPDFIATENTQVFDGTPLLVSPELHHALYHSVDENLRLVRTRNGRIDVRYSNGVEVFIDPKKKSETECDSTTGDEMTGFTELLPRVTYEILKGKVVWSHWEQAPEGILPIFHYEASLLWNFPRRCQNEVKLPRPTLVDFRGEVAINPTNGSFSRITERLHYDLHAAGPKGVVTYTMVTYGPVQIGGQTYICPRRSIGLGLGPAFIGSSSDEESLKNSFGLSEEPTLERVDDVIYTDYHIFRAKSRILPGTAPGPPPSGPATRSRESKPARPSEPSNRTRTLAPPSRSPQAASRVSQAFRLGSLDRLIRCDRLQPLGQSRPGRPRTFHNHPPHRRKQHQPTLMRRHHPQPMRSRQAKHKMTLHLADHRPHRRCANRQKHPHPPPISTHPSHT
jgi:hypothetical protein